MQNDWYCCPKGCWNRLRHGAKGMYSKKGWTITGLSDISYGLSVSERGTMGKKYKGKKDKGGKKSAYNGTFLSSLFQTKQ